MYFASGLFYGEKKIGYNIERKKNRRDSMSDFSFEIVEHIGVLGEGKDGWRKELNRVSYSGHKPKFDIRSWNEDHSKMSKGITKIK